jgi:hypothetical protein
MGPGSCKGQARRREESVGLDRSIRAGTSSFTSAFCTSASRNATDVPLPFPTLMAVPSSAPLQRIPPKHPVVSATPPPSSSAAAPPMPTASMHSQWHPVRVKGKPGDVPLPSPTLAVPSSAPLQRTPPKHPVEATSPPPSSAPPRPGPSTHSQHTVMPPPLASPLQRPPSMQSMVSPKAPTPRVTQQPIGTPLSKTPKTSIAALLCSNNSCFKGIRKSLVSGCTHKTLQHWMICAMRSTTTPY